MIEQLRKKFPTANHDPRPGCKYCGGSGVRQQNGERPCICIYVSHDLADFAAESLAATAKKLREELKP